MSQSSQTGYFIASLSGLFVAVVFYTIVFVRYYTSQHTFPNFYTVLFYGSDVFDVMLLGVVVFLVFGTVRLFQSFT